VREGVELSSGFTATINADLKVGTLAETVTVSGRSPLVDVQSTQSQQVLTNEVIEAVPSTRGFATFIDFTPGVRQTSAAHDVGGTQQDNMQDGSLWGGRATDFRIYIDGMDASTLLGTGRGRGLMLNSAMAQETNIVLGEAERYWGRERYMAGSQPTRDQGCDESRPHGPSHLAGRGEAEVHLHANQ
jgi:hypothetical protein